MNPPAVRSLDELYNAQSPIYDQINAQTNAQVQQAQTRAQAGIAGVDAAKDAAFGNIEQRAASRGALFGGFSPDAQAQYTASTYLPARLDLLSKTEDTINGLNNNLLQTDLERRKTAQGQHDQDLSQLYDYNKTMSDRQFQTEQANTAYQQELQKLRLSASLSAGAAKANLPSTAQFLVSAFSGYDPSKGNGYTEKEVIPSLMANYGLTSAQASALAYNYRKQVYKE